MIDMWISWGLGADRMGPAGMALVILFTGTLAAVVGLLWRGFLSYRARLLRIERLLQSFQPGAGLEHNLDRMLEFTAGLIEASGYAYYVWDPAAKQYSLKAVRQRSDDLGQIAPSYSGLLPYKKEHYYPPVSLPPGSVPAELTMLKDGEVPLLSFALGKAGVIRIGPVSKLKRSERSRLVQVQNTLTKLTETSWESERLRMESEVVVASAAALHAVGSMALDSFSLIRKIGAMLKTALELQKLLVVVPTGSAAAVPVCLGWPDETGMRLMRSQEWLLGLIKLKRQMGAGVSIMESGDPRLEKLKEQMSLPPGSRVLLADMPWEGINGVLVGIISEDSSSEGSLAAASVATTLKEIALLQQQQNGVKSLTGPYAELMKTMARSIDSLSPYTVGYSELMGRYSVIIAQELRLPQEEIRVIALAACLSNIGVLGLTEELYLKEGKFTEVEFEKMKLHAEVGAAIVEMTLGNAKVASYIRHHHERVDGNGYPSRLKGAQIPVGAQIIAVVQTFLAKINGRRYRDPLPFDKALQILQSAAGAQLSPEVVQAFVNWFRTKQKDPATAGRSLGPCWEMCCSPAEVCSGCPAFGRTEWKCWEVPDNRCTAHGKSCKTCYVYTEHISRSALR